MDVAAVGFGKKELLIKNRAKSGDRVVLLGGPTGRDGMGGAQLHQTGLNQKTALQYRYQIRSSRK